MTTVTDDAALTAHTRQTYPVPDPSLPEVHPDIAGLDDLELLRQGLLTQDLLDLPPGPATYVDAEGVPVASVDEAGKLRWLSPRSSRPYERWHTGLIDLTAPIAVVDHPGRLASVRGDAATTVVLASTDAGRADLHLVRMARQRATETDSRLVVLPLGSRSKRRPLKLARILEKLREIGPVTNATSDDLSSFEPAGVGLVVFFTGFSGSGKSTVARALGHYLIENYGAEVSLLDGDVVRRNLSYGLTFSMEDRNANVRRIGWVAAEIARHGGIAIASPIAPFDVTRREVQRMVTERGGRFLLVHVNTPLKECERRDRKGLYAKARAGLIPDFTGISSPYEPPEDAHLCIDTTGVEINVLRDMVLSELEKRGWLGTGLRLG
ncbi:MAG: adenylyl-sulfate kinase [Tessaracoccus sp.]|uniref:adenylyl-sulfate kinase n=1 Tax=Tessaracoccus sp. TaxID=1971211 RepID=UPI001ED5522A|nr:adenylyl-sulfate kinase [Tessaracoccus sp.]MBK7822183.1 adenylyl-sulfate kinase [Tessaracoccus sp.]